MTYLLNLHFLQIRFLIQSNQYDHLCIYDLNLNQIDPDKAEEILQLAEKKEKESNQIIEFTREIKKYPMEFQN